MNAAECMALCARKRGGAKGGGETPYVRRKVGICDCLDFTPISGTITHTPSCDSQKLRRHPSPIACWLAGAVYTRTPWLLHTNQVCTSAPKPVPGVETPNWMNARHLSLLAAQPSHDLPAQRDLLVEGYQRIDRFVAIINYARQHIDSCKGVYVVTTALLLHYFAQLHRLIVGKSAYRLHAAAFHRYSGLAPVPKESYANTGRQAGKTTIVGLVLAALLCCANPSDLVGLYATTQNQATLVLRTAKRIFFALPETMRPKIVIVNAAHTFSVLSDYRPEVVELSENDARRYGEVVIAANAAKVLSVRGQAYDAIVCDESMMMEEDFFKNHIKPLMTVADRPLICISTPGPQGSYMVRQCKLMAEHPEEYPNSVFLNYSLVCERHRAENPLCCRDHLNYLPPWRTMADIRQLEKEYETRGAADFLREVMGEPTDSSARIFSAEDLRRTFTAERLTTDSFRPAGNVIYLAIDPAKGGACDMTIISFCYWNGLCIILGLEAFSTTRCDMLNIEDLLAHHVRLLRAMCPSWSQPAHLIPLVEDNGNLTVAASLVSFVLQKCGYAHGCLGYNIDRDWRSQGVCTTEVVKDRMIADLQRQLAFGTLRFCATAVTTGRRSATTTKRSIGTSDMVIKYLWEQLERFHYDEKMRATGKIGMDANDDLASALLVGIHWSGRCREAYPILIHGRVGS